MNFKIVKPDPFKSTMIAYSHFFCPVCGQYEQIPMSNGGVYQCPSTGSMFKLTNENSQHEE